MATFSVVTKEQTRVRAEMKAWSEGKVDKIKVAAVSEERSASLSRQMYEDLKNSTSSDFICISD